VEVLVVEGLSKSFGGVHALKGVTFSVRSGERVAIIGPNGAGKTTLFNTLNGQFSPTAGHVHLLGRDITKLPTHRRAHLGMGRSFQITNLLSNLTVLHNALLAFEGMSVSRFQCFRTLARYDAFMSSAEHLLTKWGLWEKRDSLVRDIGYGEQRRLEIAMSLASEPKLLLLDEPSCGMTAEECQDISRWLRDLGESMAVIMIGHDMDLVFDVAERILVMRYGEIMTEGTCEEIRSDARVKELYMGSEAAAC
jgi:branched-chain amino acid transport system ATP-binding protein